MPAVPSEFEEKEFEAPLYNQLGSGTRLVWSPGQVFEEYIGIDHALFLHDAALWRFFGTAGPLRGALLHRFDWDFIWRRRGRRPLPNFRLNLFLQAKRSHYYRRRPRTLRTVVPSGVPCWRFNLDPAQQEALERVAAKLGDRAIVAYAAPVFHRISQLNAHTVHGTMLANSTFPRVESLHGHSAWYYTEPGGSGFANPDVTPIEGMGLERLLEAVVAKRPSDTDGSVSEQLAILSGVIERTVMEEVSDENPRKALFFQRVREIDPMVATYEERPESLRWFLRVATFASAFNLDWYAVG
jgi:hypothetical protein